MYRQFTVMNDTTVTMNSAYGGEQSYRRCSIRVNAPQKRSNAIARRVVTINYNARSCGRWCRIYSRVCRKTLVRFTEFCFIMLDTCIVRILKWATFFSNNKRRMKLTYSQCLFHRTGTLFLFARYEILFSIIQILVFI